MDSIETFYLWSFTGNRRTFKNINELNIDIEFYFMWDMDSFIITEQTEM